MLKVIFANLLKIILTLTYAENFKKIKEEGLGLLVIDDLGTEQGTEWSLSKIYTILDSRYRKKLPTIVTSNYSLGQLKERYGERIVDRLIEMCINIENKNPSIRKIKAEENKEKLRGMLGG
ncbi:ATP-binding protein [Caproiciproducens sp. MSJ-32]|uniref:ATP-binding protein n=1 Tax=Caproiciproducens sp. MSJ-32 TaxID=2841527 RepID=UPI001C1077DC|nr:ATP-binding protein [Caproiciproducens sp. MSJ-32]